MLRFYEVDREGIFTGGFLKLRFILYPFTQFISSDVIATPLGQLRLWGYLILVKITLGLSKVIFRLQVPLLVVLDGMEFQQVRGAGLADDLLLLYEWEWGMKVVLVVLLGVGWKGRTVEGVGGKGELGGLLEEGLGRGVVVGTHDSISNNYYIFHS